MAPARSRTHSHSRCDKRVVHRTGEANYRDVRRTGEAEDFSRRISSHLSRVDAHSTCQDKTRSAVVTLFALRAVRQVRQRLDARNKQTNKQNESLEKAAYFCQDIFAALRRVHAKQA